MDWGAIKSVEKDVMLISSFMRKNLQNFGGFGIRRETGWQECRESVIAKIECCFAGWLACCMAVWNYECGLKRRRLLDE